MKRVVLVCFVSALLLTSCTWQIAPFPASTPTVVPIDLAGPDIAVGLTYAYANDTLLAAVPAGEFTMGHGGTDNPVDQVWLKDFWISRTKVTNKQYASCVSLGYCTPPDAQDNPAYTDASKSDNPVVGVSYDQAVTYCAFMNARLPTEAEWEKAARGPQANIYPWGNGAPSCNLLNFNNCIRTTTNVNLYLQGKSYYGALDMEGNAFEWVADWYDPNYYQTASSTNPLGPDSGKSRSVRSSSYQSTADQVAASMRFFALPSDHRPDLGFRCAVDQPSPQAVGALTLTVLPTPSVAPSLILTAIASSLPTLNLTVTPLSLPTLNPTIIPTSVPPLIPTLAPTSVPKLVPTLPPLP
jgi:formylglycine-generating enzyme required for sulfatase activity